ncbi:flagellar assembly protein FliW [Aquibacillus kalidii]|uniref:flagellar assembly protein FliW n=1 Tax=Aquibacillus kalidii TaxID=2762597 RepID=UPI001647855D|nr:flagellar assembly protein FliW [Aquibacillus kalidii]
MLIQTKYFGEIEINKEQIIEFTQGIPGFLEERQFVLLPLEENEFFYVLQSVKHANPAFIVVNPFHFVSQYEFDLDEVTLKLLDIESQSDVQVLCIVSLKEPFETSTANLQAPIIINHKNKRARQYITNSKDYSTKERLFMKSNTSEVKED